MSSSNFRYPTIKFQGWKVCRYSCLSGEVPLNYPAMLRWWFGIPAGYRQLLPLFESLKIPFIFRGFFTPFSTKVWSTFSYAWFHCRGDGEESSIGWFKDATGWVDFYHTQLCQVHSGAIVFLIRKCLGCLQIWGVFFFGAFLRSSFKDLVIYI